MRKFITSAIKRIVGANGYSTCLHAVLLPNATQYAFINSIHLCRLNVPLWQLLKQDFQISSCSTVEARCNRSATFNLQGSHYSHVFFFNCGKDRLPIFWNNTRIISLFHSHDELMFPVTLHSTTSLNIVFSYQNMDINGCIIHVCVDLFISSLLANFM